MSIPIFIVDAFTDKPFAGNPAAICCIEKDLPNGMKQKIATEMNLSETAFVTLKSSEENFTNGKRFGLRWFTPTNEVPLCGHATLASAAVLFNKHKNQNAAIEFETLSGVLLARRNKNSGITLDFPINPPIAYEAPNLEDLKRITVKDLSVQDIQLSHGAKKLVLRLNDSYSREDLEKVNPETHLMEEIERSGLIKGIIITLLAKSDEPYDFYCRYFAPWNGIPEDPVTGSAFTVLGPYWHRVLSKTEFYARQCSKRGGDLSVKLVNERVEITGQATHVLDGTIHIE